MNTEDIKKVRKKYELGYKKYGYSPSALDWLKGKQDIRFDILTSCYHFENKRILDIGCGFGDLNNTLQRKYPPIDGASRYDYCGIDLVDCLLEEGKKHFHGKNIKFLNGDFMSFDFNEKFDYAISSGVFNTKLSNPDENYDFIYQAMEKALSLCKDGIAFDFLSNKVDYQLEHTFHSNPCKILDMAYSFSRRVILRNDYMPFEFSVFVFNDASFAVEDTLFTAYKNTHQ